MWITNKGLDMFGVLSIGEGISLGRWNGRIGDESKASGGGRWIKLVVRLLMTNKKYKSWTFYSHSLWNPQ